MTSAQPDLDGEVVAVYGDVITTASKDLVVVVVCIAR